MSRPLPTSALYELRSYLNGLNKGQVRLFGDVNVRKEFDKFRGKTTRQDLRRTFSTLMQMIGPISSAQQLLEHYSPRTTEEFYSDRELLLRWRVNQLPVDSWLK